MKLSNYNCFGLVTVTCDQIKASACAVFEEEGKLPASQTMVNNLANPLTKIEPGKQIIATFASTIYPDTSSLPVFRTIGGDCLGVEIEEIDAVQAVVSESIDELRKVFLDWR